MPVRQPLKVYHFVKTAMVSVPYRLRDRFMDQLEYIPIWEPETKRWQIRASDESRVRRWLDAEMAKPWPKRAA